MNEVSTYRWTQDPSLVHDYQSFWYVIGFRHFRTPRIDINDPDPPAGDCVDQYSYCWSWRIWVFVHPHF